MLMIIVFSVNSRTLKNIGHFFSNINVWFVDSKLSIYFNEDKTKSILLVTKIEAEKK